MSTPLTLEDIWKLFQETNHLFQKSQSDWERRFQENERLLRMEREEREKERIEREKERFEREKERIEREKERIEREKAREKAREKERIERAEAERIFKEERAEADRRFQEEQAKARAEADRHFQETERVVKDVSRQIGRLGGRWGEFVEGMVAPACETMFAERGIPVHKVHPRTKAKLPGNRHMEIDLLVINTTAVVAVEVKSDLKIEDVRWHADKLSEFKEFYPEYADRQIMGAVAGIVMGEGVDRFAMNLGLFVIVQSGENVRLANDLSFVPRIW
ncbi:MAG: DUF3782 domain-containing protein [Magnetococcus sp. DMHC-1]